MCKIFCNFPYFPQLISPCSQDSIPGRDSIPSTVFSSIDISDSFEEILSFSTIQNPILTVSSASESSLLLTLLPNVQVEILSVFTWQDLGPPFSIFFCVLCYREVGLVPKGSVLVSSAVWLVLPEPVEYFAGTDF